MIQPMSVSQNSRSPAAQVGLERDLLGDLHEEAAVHVHRALRPAGRAARVRDEQRVLAVDVEPRRTRSAPSAHELVEREVATRRASARRCDRGAARRRPCARSATCATAASAVSFIGTTLPRRVKPSAVIERDRVRVLEPDRDRVGAVAGEDRQEDRAELRDREQRGDRLGHHRQEQPDRVALAARRAPRAPTRCDRSARAARVHVSVRTVAVLAFPDDRGVVARRGIVGAPVDARRSRGCSARR